MKLSRWFLFCGLVIAVVLISEVRVAAEFQENFSGATENASLKSVDGWSAHSGEGKDAKVELAAGYSGLGARIETNEQYKRTISPDQAVVLDQHEAAEFRAKLRVMASTDGYVLSQVLIGENDGIHGLAVRFNGGSRDGSSDNFIQVSNGGDNWGRITFDDLKKATWKKETWYEILITDIVGTPDGKSAEGKLTIRTAEDAPETLVDAQPIRSFGAAGKFTKLNVICVGNCGTARAFDVDDFSLGLVKKGN